MGKTKKSTTCGWAHTGPAPTAAVGVVIQRACAHGRQYVDTCQEHKDYFDRNGGRAKNPATCEQCGHRGHSLIVDTYQVTPR